MAFLEMEIFFLFLFLQYDYYVIWMGLIHIALCIHQCTCFSSPNQFNKRNEHVYFMSFNPFGRMSISIKCGFEAKQQQIPFSYLPSLTI